MTVSKFKLEKKHSQNENYNDLISKDISRVSNAQSVNFSSSAFTNFNKEARKNCPMKTNLKVIEFVWEFCISKKCLLNFLLKKNRQKAAKSENFQRFLRQDRYSVVLENSNSIQDFLSSENFAQYKI